MTRPISPDFLTAEQPHPLTLTLPLRADAFELYRRMAIPGRPSFLLESPPGSTPTARYSFLATDPYRIVRGRGDGAFHALAAELRQSMLPRRADLPSFIGGAIGFFSYDLVRQFERLPARIPDDGRWPDVCFGLVELVAAIDHEARLIHLVFAPPGPRLRGEPRDKLYREGCDRLAELAARLACPSVPRQETRAPFNIQPEQTRADYVERVRACQRYIAAGDIYQTNLSHRFRLTAVPGGRPPIHQWYGALRARNPSPFAGVADFGDLVLISGSPERLVRLAGRRAETRPIAGTRPRGEGRRDDQYLVQELRTHPKERAEHLMLVDLERNDLGRVCRYGSVQVDEFMAVEQYSHVSHLVSSIRGELRDDVTGFDLIRAMFPGGTITGVPKIRCMEIIEELEPVRRGPYTGSLGYLSWSGDLDLNITIRSIAVHGHEAVIQVGAGIVADSDPDKEYEETLYKAGAMVEAVTGCGSF